MSRMIRAVIFDYGGVLRRRVIRQTKLLSLATELRQQGIKTAVLSNMVRPVAAVFRHSPELKDFNPVIISCDEGVSKPNPEIYKLMLKQLNLPAKNCIFIDNRTDNIAAAQELGFQVVRAQSTDQVILDVKRLLKTNG